MHLFYIYSFTFEFILFTLLLILLLHYTGLATTTNWNKLKQNSAVLNTIQILFYFIEIFFIIIICKIYWWTLYQFIWESLQLYTSWISYVGKFLHLLLINWQYSILYLLLLLTTGIQNLLIFGTSLFSLTQFSQLWYNFNLINFSQIFNIILILTIVIITHITILYNWFIHYLSIKILFWLQNYSIIPIFSINFNNINFNINLYHYSLFDYSIFSFYNKYIILIFLIFYYSLVYGYYKLPVLSTYTNNITNKFNYLFSYEYPILLGFLYLGYILVITTNNLLLVYLGFEIQTFTILILSGQIRSVYSVSLANLKYFFYSFFSSLTFLLSLLYIYNFTNTLNYYELYLYLLYNWELNLNNLFIYSGFLLLLLSFLFKLGVFPFYIWVLDIFEGFPRLITILLLTLNKFNLYIFLLKFLTIITTFNLFLFNWLVHLLTIVSLSSLFIGSLLALTQTNIHRFFGATSITHMGLLLLLIKMTLIQNNINTYYIIYSYFILYMGLTLLFFCILLLWSSFLTSQYSSIIFKQSNNFNFNFIKDLNWLNIYSKKSILILILILLNFSGFPPFSFFYIKFNLILLLANNQLYFDTLLILYFSTIITGSYIRLISIIYLENSITNSVNMKLYKYFIQNQTTTNLTTKYYINKVEYISLLITLILLFYNYVLYLY